MADIEFTNSPAGYSLNTQFSGGGLPAAGGPDMGNMGSFFAEMARRAALNMNTNIPATEAYMRMGLRAQNQARATLETLSAMKNPSVVIARHANISAGHQQVNNVLVEAGMAQPQNQPIQLSGEAHELHQDP